MTFELPFPRTAIVTGGARRIGAAIATALAADGWDILIHCNRSVAEAEALAASLERARVVAVDLAEPDAASAIDAALEGMPPPGLLVNNASRFEFDTFDDFTIEGWSAHLDANLRAPALLSRLFAARAREGGVIVNLLDAKLAALNPDHFTYTISKIGLAGLTELSARLLAPRNIRVCAIAPAVTLPSGPQSEDDFAAVHALNPLGRGVEVGDIVDALRYIIGAPRLTGQTLLLDAGQRFLGFNRDVQYLEQE